MEQEGRILVRQYWTPLRDQEKWRHWIPREDWQDYNRPLDFTRFWESLQSRKILTQHEQDKLRWGHQPKGSFTIKEDYLLEVNQEIQIKDPIWNNIWDPHLWPKVKTFL